MGHKLVVPLLNTLTAPGTTAIELNKVFFNLEILKTFQNACGPAHNILGASKYMSKHITRHFLRTAIVVALFSATTAFAQQVLCPKWSLQYWKQAGLISPDGTRFMDTQVLGNGKSGTQMLEEMLACFDIEFNTKAQAVGGAQWRSNSALQKQYQEYDKLRTDHLTGQANIAATHKVAPFPAVAYLSKQRELLTAKIGAISAASAPPQPPVQPPAGAGQAAPTLNVPTQIKSVNIPNAFLRHRNATGVLTPVVSDLDKKDSTFILRAGLAGAGVSFESANFPGRFLRHQNGRILLSPGASADLFKKDASFHQRPGLAGKGVSFESVNFPGAFLRHCGGAFYIDDAKGKNKACNPNANVAKQDASFELVGAAGAAALPATTPSAAPVAAPAAAPAAKLPVVPPAAVQPGSDAAAIEACIQYVDEKVAAMQRKFDTRQADLKALGDSAYNTWNSNLKTFTAYKNQLNAAKSVVMQNKTKKSCDDAKAEADGKEKMFPTQIK